MRPIVGDVSTDVRALSASMARAVGSGGGGAASNPLGLGGGGSNFGIGSKRTDLTQHTEQYRHFQGWVAASIAPIAKRIARQPVHLARVRTGDAVTPKTPAPFGTKASTTRVTASKPWERPSDPHERAKRAWFKSALPGAFKSAAPKADLIDQHPLLDALDDPNPIMVRWSLLFVTVASLMLTGKAYWWVKARERDGNDAPTGDASPSAGAKIDIWPLPSNWVKPVHTEERLYHHWEVTPEGALEPTPVPADQIVYFYFPDPSSPLGASSQLQHQARAVVSDEAIAEAQRRGFANGVFPGVAVVVGRAPDINGAPGDRPVLNKDQRAQIITAFKQAYRGVYNADEPIILDQLIQDVKRVTNTNREMDFRESGQYTKERITQGFGVNPITMGQVEGANRASSATADDHLCQSTVNPIIELMSEVLTAWLNPIFAQPGEKLVLFIEEARAIDPDSERADWDLLARYGAASRDELRAGVKNLPPIIDGDQALIASGMVPIDARLAETPGQTSGKPLVPAPAPGSEGDGPAAPKPGAPDPAQSSEPPAPDESAPKPEASAVRVADVLDVLDRMARRGYAPRAAESVLETGFGLTPSAARRAVAACAVSRDVLAEVGAAQITGVLRVLREAGADPADSRSASLLDVPDVRQREPYDCGAAAGRAVAEYCGCDTPDPEAFMRLLGTTAQNGTSAGHLFDYFAAQGCDPREKWGATVDHLRAECAQGRPVLCPVQYFGDGPAPGGESGENADGHWVTVTGFGRDEVRFNCPIDGPGAVSRAAFNANWYDRDGDTGEPLVRYALSAGHRPSATVDPDSNTGNVGGSGRAVKVTDASGHEHDQNGRFGSNGSGHATGTPKPSDKPPPHAPLSAGGHETGSVADKPEDLAKRAGGFLDKIKEHGAKAVATAKAVGERAHQLVIQGSYHAMTKNLADDICDTSHDYSKIINAKGTGDWLSEHLGVSGSFAAKVGAVALSYGYTKLKEHIKRRHQASLMLPTKPVRAAGDDPQDSGIDHLTIEQAAHHVTDINRALLSGLGCPEDQLPEFEDVLAWLRQRHAAGAPAGTDGADSTAPDDTDPAPKHAPGAYRCKAKVLTTKERLDAWEKAHASAAGEIKGALVRFFRAERERVLDELPAALAAEAKNWTRAAPLPADAPGTDDEPAGTEGADPHVGPLLDRLFPLATMTRRLVAHVRDSLAAVAEDGAAQENDALAPVRAADLDAWAKAGKPVDRKPLPRQIRQRVNEYLDDMVGDPYWTDINRTTRDKMARAVRRGLANAETVEQIQERVKGSLSALGDDIRAEMIARTEATAALNVGFQAAREHYGPKYVKGKMWTASAVHENTQRPTHKAANGQTRKNGSKFRVGGVWCEYPGDPALPPKERCNCRCVALTVPAD